MLCTYCCPWLTDGRGWLAVQAERAGAGAAGGGPEFRRGVVYPAVQATEEWGGGRGSEGAVPPRRRHRGGRSSPAACPARVVCGAAPGRG